MGSELIQIGNMRSSSMGRVKNCPGSAIICGGERSTSDEYSATGTVAHGVLEKCLTFGFEPEDFAGDVVNCEGFNITVDEEMVEAVRFFVVWYQYAKPKDAVVSFEQFLSGASIGLPQVTGHIDLSMYSPSQRILIVSDFKYGVGVTVEAFENEQLLTYALLKATELREPVDKIVLVIVQPRSQGGPVSSWQIGFDRLTQHLKDVSRTARVVEYLTENPNEVESRLHPGDHCQFCPALLKCPAVTEPTTNELSLLPLSAEGFLLSLTDNELAYWFSRRKEIRKWLTELEKRTKQRHREGPGIPNHKLVKTIANRTWIKDEIETVKALQEFSQTDATNLYSQPKLLGPAAIEKLPPPKGKTKKEVKEFIATLVHRPPTGETLVHETDKRKSSEIKVAEMFADET